jgi:hypothetical protein
VTSARRTAALTALAVPLILVALAALVVLSGDRFMGCGQDPPCPEIDVPLGDIAEGPRGWSAMARYEQWLDSGQCLGSLGVSFFAPGVSWEDEAWAPAAHVVVRSGLLSPPTRERAWITWDEDGRPLLLGFGNAATPLIVDALPDAAGGLAIRRCPTVERSRTDVPFPDPDPRDCSSSW